MTYNAFMHNDNIYRDAARAIKAAKIASYIGERGISGPRVKYISDETILDVAQIVEVNEPSSDTIAIVREILTEGVD